MAVVPSGKYTKKGAIIWKAAPRRQPTRRKSTTPTPSKRTPVAYGGPTREASTTQITEAKAKGLDYYKGGVRYSSSGQRITPTAPPVTTTKKTAIAYGGTRSDATPTQVAKAQAEGRDYYKGGVRYSSSGQKVTKETVALRTRRLTERIAAKEGRVIEPTIAPASVGFYKKLETISEPAKTETEFKETEFKDWYENKPVFAKWVAPKTDEGYFKTKETIIPSIAKRHTPAAITTVTGKELIEAGQPSYYKQKEDYTVPRWFEKWGVSIGERQKTFFNSEGFKRVEATAEILHTKELRGWGGETGKQVLIKMMSGPMAFGGGVAMAIEKTAFFGTAALIPQIPKKNIKAGYGSLGSIALTGWDTRGVLGKVLWEPVSEVPKRFDPRTVEGRSTLITAAIFAGLTASTQVSSPGRAGTVLKQTAKQPPPRVKGTISYGIKKIPTKIQTTDILKGFQKITGREPIKPSHLATSKYMVDIRKPGVIVGKTVGAKAPSTFVKVKGVQYGTMKIKGAKGATKGKTYYIRTQTKAGKATTKVFEGDILLKTVKHKVEPTLKFKEPSVKGKYKGVTIKGPELTKETFGKFEEAKAVSMIKGYKVEGGKVRATKETIITVTETPKITYIGRIGREIFKTKYQHVKHPVKEPPFIIEKGAGVITIKRPAVSKTIQRTAIKEGYEVQLIKTPKPTLLEKIKPTLPRGKKGGVITKGVTRQIQRPTGKPIISKPVTVTLPLLKPIVKATPITTPLLIPRARTREVAKEVSIVKEAAVTKEAAKAMPITRVVPKLEPKVIQRAKVLPKQEARTTLRGIPRTTQRTTPGRSGYDFTTPTPPRQPPKVPRAIMFNIYGAAISPRVIKKQPPTKKKFKGMPSLSVVMGSQGVQLTKPQIEGKAFINPFIPRKV